MTGIRLPDAPAGSLPVRRFRGAAEAIPHDELERRLLEMGFVEGARFQVLHEGPIGRDPIAIKLDDMRLALRRREARSVCVALDATGPAPQA